MTNGTSGAYVERAARAAPLLLTLCLLLPAGGCFRSHAIEPGTWRLTILPNEAGRAREGTAPKPKDVVVTVDWGKEKNTESVKVEYEKPAPAGELFPKRYRLQGTLTKDGKIELKGHDDFWTLNLLGEARSRQAMTGQVWARGRIEDTSHFTGRWQMVKVMPEG